MAATQGVIVRDPHLWAALAAAPVFWIALWCWNLPAFDPLWPFRQPLHFFAVALVYPVLEEIVFRGGLQPWLQRDPRAATRYYGASVANIVSSALFASLHLFRHPPGWAAAMFLPSLLFGYFRDRHNSLKSPIVLHVSYNAGYFWLFGA